MGQAPLASTIDGTKLQETVLQGTYMCSIPAERSTLAPLGLSGRIRELVLITTIERVGTTELLAQASCHER
jgi:hypothetical protein